MDRWILTAVCLAGLALAASMAWKWHALERVDHGHEEVPTGWAGVRRVVRSMAVLVNAGIIAGVLVGGLGGRLFMRVMAATSDDFVQSTLTDAEEPIGRVTFGGTLSLILFGGLFGGFLMIVLYRVLRGWLPAKAWQAGALLGVVGLGAFGGLSEMLSRDNVDFEVLSPTPLAALLVVLGAVFFGVVLVTVYERLDRGMAHPDRWSLGLVPFAPLPLLGLSVIAIPVVVGVLLVAAFLPTAVRWWTTSPAVARVGQVVVGVALVASLAISGNEIAAIAT